MIRLAQRPCPICSQASVEVLHSQRFVLPEGHPLSEGYDVVCCPACGFVYADTAVSQDAYDRFYAQYSKYEDQNTGTGGGETPWDRTRLEETAGQITAFLDDPEREILDVGCANGGLLKALQDKGYRHLVGIDPSPTCVENTRRLGIEAECGSLFTPFRPAAFDCVILSHTLEHVQDIRQAAGWIDAVLRHDRTSWVYIEVPDAARYADFVYAPFQDFNTEHINHFSLASLKNYLRANGFSPADWGEKLLETSPAMIYPAVYCFAGRKVGRGGPAIEKDSQLKERLERYINVSRRVLDRIEARLHPALADADQVIVWGTGQLTMKLLVETSLAQARIAAFVDSNPINQGKILRGVAVIAPQAVAGIPYPIVIGTILHQKSVAEQIRKMGLPNPVIFLAD